MDTRWSQTTKLLVLICLIVFGVWLLFRFAAIISPLLVAVIIAYLLKPPTDWLVRRTGWPRGLAVIVLFLILILLIVLAPVLITPSVASIIRNINLDLNALDPLWQQLSAAEWEIGPFTLSGSELAPDLSQALQNIVTPFASGALQLVSGVALSLFYLVFVVVVIFWLLKDSYNLERWFIEHISPSYQGEVTYLLREIGEIWGNFFRGELALAVVVGALVALSMSVLGLPNVFLLAFFAALGEFVPTIGPVFAAIPAILIALVSGSNWLPLPPLLLALIVAIVYTTIFQIEQIYFAAAHCGPPCAAASGCGFCRHHHRRHPDRAAGRAGRGPGHRHHASVWRLHLQQDARSRAVRPAGRGRTGCHRLAGADPRPAGRRHPVRSRWHPDRHR